jgi:hypothetical protein
MRSILLVCSVWSVCIVLAACDDPIRQQSIDSLGGEQPGVPKGPLHRPGQPCNVCHDGNGPGSSVFSFAGTVYQTPGTKVPLANALVRLVDSAGKKYDTATNCAGNFFVMEADYAASFPVWTKVVFGVQPGGAPLERVMGSPIYREGSCAKCHGDKEGPESAGKVSFAPDGALSLPTEPCPR